MSSQVPDGQSYREITQIVHLEKVLGHCGFSKAEGEKFLDLCLTLEAECEVTVVDTVPRGCVSSVCAMLLLSLGGVVF